MAKKNINKKVWRKSVTISGSILSDCLSLPKGEPISIIASLTNPIDGSSSNSSPTLIPISTSINITPNIDPPDPNKTIGSFHLNVDRILRKEFENPDKMWCSSLLIRGQQMVVHGKLYSLLDVDYTDPKAKLKFGLDIHYLIMGEEHIGLEHRLYVFIPEGQQINPTSKFLAILNRDEKGYPDWINYNKVVQKCYRVLREVGKIK